MQHDKLTEEFEKIKEEAGAAAERVKAVCPHCGRCPFCGQSEYQYPYKNPWWRSPYKLAQGVNSCAD